MALEEEVFDFEHTTGYDDIAWHIVRLVHKGGLPTDLTHIGRVINVPRLDGFNKNSGIDYLVKAAETVVEASGRIMNKKIRVDYTSGEDGTYHIPDFSESDIIVHIVQDDPVIGEASDVDIFIEQVGVKEKVEGNYDAIVRGHKEPECEDFETRYRAALKGVSLRNVIRSELPIECIERIEMDWHDDSVHGGTTLVYRNDQGQPWVMLQANYARRASFDGEDEHFDGFAKYLEDNVLKDKVSTVKESVVAGKGNDTHTTKEYFLKEPFDEEFIFLKLLRGEAKEIDLADMSIEIVRDAKDILYNATTIPYDIKID